jgi:two-component system response regulator PilR (NtrC family)
MQVLNAQREEIVAENARAVTPKVSNSLRQTSFFGMVSECNEMQKIFAVVEKVAKTNATVLVLGESGTGKELIAKALHRISGRTGRLVPVNCGAIPEEILESELFGHEKGSFTGAINTRIGRFQLADKGTIFLDEIGEMSPKLQVKLLRVLQERKIEPVGSTKSIDIDVRVVAATNKDLREEVKAGRFREDLYYRLQVVPVELPALRLRSNDAALLATHFLERATQNLGVNRLTFAPATLNILAQYTWPGNIRELENLIERLAVLADGDVLTPDMLPEYIAGNPREETHVIELATEIPADGIDFNQLVDDYETKLIMSALSKTKGNKKAAARLLQLNRTTLVEKIKKKGLEREVETENDSDALSDEQMLAESLITARIAL